MTDDIKVRIQKGSNQIIFFKEKDGVEFIKFKYDVATLKRQLSAIEGRKAGIQIYQKTNKEMQDFVENVTFQQSNYQLIVVYRLLERNCSKNELLDFITEFNRDKVTKNTSVFEVLQRKGIIKVDVDNLYAINSDLSNEKRKDLSYLALARLEQERKN